MSTAEKNVLMIPWTRLPMSFDPAPLRAELDAIAPERWKIHFNRADYEGQWSSVSLRSRSGRVDDGVAHGEVAEFQDTAMMQQCPHMRAVVEAFAFPKKAVRLLRLQAGSRVKEHCDRDLGLADGELRIHVPIATNDKLEFVVSNRRLVLREGEAWYIDFSQPHRIFNGGDSDRTHLVIDGRVNEWAQELLERGVREVVTETEAAPGVARFKEFCEQVCEDAALQDELMLEMAPGVFVGQEEFLGTVISAGAKRGYELNPEVVESFFTQQRKEWLQRSVGL